MAGRASTTTSMPAASGARCRTSSWSTPARANRACSAEHVLSAAGDPADRGDRPLDLLLPELPGAAAAAPAEEGATAGRAGRGEVSEPAAAAGGLRRRALVGSGGRDRLHSGDPAIRDAGWGLRARWRAGDPRDRHAAAARQRTGGERDPDHRRQRLRAGGGGRRRSLARGARARLLHPVRAGAAGARGGDLRPALGRSGAVRPGPDQGYAACEARPSRGCRSGARSAPGPARRWARSSAASGPGRAASAMRRSSPGRATRWRRWRRSMRPGT